MKYLISLCLLLMPFFLSSDDAEEKLFSMEEESFHANELSELLAQLKENPLNINRAAKTELQRLPWLSEKEISSIIRHRKETPLTSFDDLTALGINSITIHEIQDYISFRDKPQLHLNQIARLEYNEAKADMKSSLKYFQRSSLEYGRFQSGFVSQKDEGERDPFDFYSYYLQYRSTGLLQKMILGKYRLALGQGILFAPKLGMSKSAEATTVPVKKFSALKPYTSSYEIWALEGGALELKLAGFYLIPFLSQTGLHANLDSLKQITSFNESGLNLDADKKNSVRETIFGSAFEYRSNDHLLGAAFSSFAFDHRFAKPASASKYNGASLYFLLFNNTSPIFSEVAMADKKLAGSAGIKFGDERMRQIILFRSYQKNFPTWHGNPFSSQSNFDNETGLYFGTTLLPAKKIKINAYFDVWNFPQTRYYEKMPTANSEQFIQIETRFPANTCRITLHHKQKEKYLNLEDAKIRDFERLLLRIDWWQQLTRLIMKTRLEFVSEYLPEDKVYAKGWLFYEQAKIKLNKLQIIAQISVYHSVCEPFKVKHYMYENNVRGIMQNSVFSGDGIASYLLLKYDIYPNLRLEAKVSDRWQTADKMRFFLQMSGSW